MSGLEINNKARKIKCLVWDLDNTLWDGVLLEDSKVTLRNEVIEIIRKLDERGILQSIASKNNHEDAMAKLKEFKLDEYFIYPQINWNAKSYSIESIAKLININLDAFAFVDDQVFEREEVNCALPQVLTIDSSELSNILDMDEMKPKFITEDSKIRRLLYQSDILRKKDEDCFTGTSEEFLASLEMCLTISNVKEGDLQRAEELTVRTHQLNSTGYTYSFDELNELRKSDKHKLIIAGLEDKYGTYGKIGLSLIECNKNEWVIKLLLMSCRVMSRGIGSIILNHIMREANKSGKKLLAEFLPTDRNRMMYISYKFAGFTEASNDRNLIILKNDLSRIMPFPDYVRIDLISD